MGIALDDIYLMRQPYDFVKRATIKHNALYSYAKVGEVVNSRSKVTITCPIHGDFTQYPGHHLAGKDCAKCAAINRRQTTSSFIKLAEETHSGLYTYNNLIYANRQTKVVVTCALHGDFQQLPGAHLNKRQGCPICGSAKKSKGESTIATFLSAHNIQWLKEHRFAGCRHKKTLPFDYYLPAPNTCIEYDGLQHFQAIPYFGGEDAFNERVVKDRLKTQFCLDNRITLIRIRYDEDITAKLQHLISPKLT